MTKCYSHPEEGRSAYLNQLTNIEIIVFFWGGGVLQFGTMVPQLRTFHMDLRPPTHALLKISMLDG